MADLSMRVLERAAAADPADPAAGLRWAQALARIGGERPARLELGRLARGGCAEAMTLLRRACAWDGGWAHLHTGRTIPRIVERARSVELSIDRDTTDHWPCVPVAMTDAWLVVRQRRRLAGLDLSDGRVAWTADVGRADGGYLLGDALFHAPLGQVELRSCATGELLAQAPCPMVGEFEAGTGPAVLAGAGDRAIVRLPDVDGPRGNAFRLVDLRPEAFGRTLGEGANESYVRPCLAGGRLHLLAERSFRQQQPDAIVAYSLEDCARVAEHVLPRGHASIEGSDERGLILGLGDCGRRPYPFELFELEGPALSRRWTFGGFSCASAMSDELFVSVGREDGGRDPMRLVAIDRRTGAARWRHTGFTRARAPGAAFRAAVAVDERTVALAVGGRGRVRLHALDAADGSLLWSQTVVVAKEDRLTSAVSLRVAEGRLVAMVWAGTRSTLIVLE